MSNEGWTTKRVTLRDIDEMLVFQDLMLTKLKGDISDNEFGQELNKLSLGTAAAAFFFPGGALALGIVSLATAFMSTISSSEKSLLSEVVGTGTSALIGLQNNMRYQLTSYDMCEIKFAYLDYESNRNTIRFIQSKINITGLRKTATKRWSFANY